jgi:hypothetical protein
METKTQSAGVPDTEKPFIPGIITFSILMGL